MKLDPTAPAVDVIPDADIDGYRISAPLGGILRATGGILFRIVIVKALNEKGEWVGLWLGHLSPGTGERCEPYLSFADVQVAKQVPLDIVDKLECACSFNGWIHNGAWWFDKNTPAPLTADLVDLAESAAARTTPH
jgi:hypothetical protein